jgi:glycosyltransferase involved in cell wall biosynthesis
MTLKTSRIGSLPVYPHSAAESAAEIGATHLSIVIPVFNEVESLQILHDKLRIVLNALGPLYEVIFIDDGSTDGTGAQLTKLAEGDPRIHVLQFARNFGQTAAIAAGFDHAAGDIIICLDADLQNDPEEIPKILDKMSEGYDVVSGWRQNRKDVWLTRVLPSRIANRLISRITGVHLHDYGCTLKAYRRDVVEHIHLYGEMHRFLPVLAAAAGARIAEIPIVHHSRIHGRSKYGLGRTIKVILDLLTVKFLGSYSTKPMYVFGGVGSLSILGATALGGITLWQSVRGNVALFHNPLTWASIFFMAMGIQAILLGMAAELVVRTYYESQRKPIYILRRNAEHVSNPERFPVASVSTVEELK